MVSTAERGIQIPISETKPTYTPSGEEYGPVALASRPKPIFKPPSSTAMHEAAHAVVGVSRNVGINGADIIPKGNALGTTYPDRFDGPTAAAGHASGTGGESHDFMLIRMHGGNPYAESTAASEVLEKHSDEYLAIGAALDEYRYLSRSDITTIYSKTEHERIERENKKTEEYIVPFKSSDGRKSEYRIEAPKKSTVLHIPVEIYNHERDSFYSNSPKDF